MFRLKLKRIIWKLVLRQECWIFKNVIANENVKKIIKQTLEVFLDYKNFNNRKLFEKSEWNINKTLPYKNIWVSEIMNTQNT